MNVLELRNTLNEMIESNPEVAEYRVIGMDQVQCNAEDLHEEPFIGNLVQDTNEFNRDALWLSERLTRVDIENREDRYEDYHTEKVLVLFEIE